MNKEGGRKEEQLGARKDAESDGAVAEDVRETYEESDLPPSRARDRAEDAAQHTERSGQAEESPDRDEKGTRAVEDRER